ncbi:hypothetical protein EVAR_86736_1 [Eumeta japonica]|uniref:Uncharacterized protein n=1 Tax=Eumeta variegata TaxID=151549 RepID=A0A4C1W2U1_EUMVA|nr:hypothetical protein EVAR_86736_1 [Eumeta japonica]
MKKKPKKRASDTRVPEKSESESKSYFDSFSDESNESYDEGFTQVQSRKACKPRLHVTYGPGFIHLSGKRLKASFLTSKVAPLPAAAAPATPPVTPSVKETYYSTPWRIVGKTNSQDAPVSQNAKASKSANSSQISKVI